MKLNECTKSSFEFIKAESLYFLMKIYLEVEKNNEKAYQFSSQLISLYPENILFGFYHLLILKNLKREIEFYNFEYKVYFYLNNNHQLKKKSETTLKAINSIC